MDESARPPGAPRSSAPTLWIIIAGVCAVLAIGFAIWAFSLKSDRDDTQAELTAAQAATGQEERSASATEAKQAAFGTRFEERYNAVRNRFIAEEKQAGDLQDDVTQEKDLLATAQSAEKQAQGQDATLQARLTTADRALSLAAGCARGTIATLDEFLDAPTVRAGADRALKRLEALQDQCDDVIKDNSGN